MIYYYYFFRILRLFVSRLGNRPISPKSLLEQEKRIRREIANSNERRRMQSINAGFQSLRTLLPHREGEKLSKVSLLLYTNNRRNRLYKWHVIAEIPCQDSFTSVVYKMCSNPRAPTFRNLRESLKLAIIYNCNF